MADIAVDPSVLKESQVFNLTLEQLAQLTNEERCSRAVSELIKRRHHYLTTDPKKWTVEDVEDFGLGEVKELTTKYPQKLEELPDDVMMEFNRKFKTLGIIPKDSEGGWSVFSKTNLRLRATTNRIVVATVGYLYRALEERSKADAYLHFKCPLNEMESKIVKSFLDDLYLYDPHRSIDRYSAGEYSKRAREFEKNPNDRDRSEAKSLVEELPMPIQRYYCDELNAHKRLKAEISISQEMTESRKTDQNTKQKYRKQPKRKANLKIKEVQYPGNEVLLQDTNIDIPMDYWAGFYNYMTVNWDAISAVATNLYWYNAIAGIDDPKTEKFKSVREDVQIMGIPHPTEEDPEPKEVLLHKTSFMGQTSEIEDTLYIHPEIFSTEQEAKNARDKISRKFLSMPWSIGRAGATIVTADWRANRKNIRTDDATFNSILEQQEQDLQLGRRMNMERIKRAKMISILESGEDSEEFHKYLAEYKGENGRQELTDEDMQKILPEIRKRMAENKIRDMDDPSFVGWVRSYALPNRNLDKDPLTYEERKKLSKKYNEEVDPPEIGMKDEVMIVDSFHQGAETFSKTRDYARAFETETRT